MSGPPTWESSWQAAQSADTSWRGHVLHLVDEQGDADAQVGGDRGGVGEQLGQVDLEVARVGPAAGGGHVDAELGADRGSLGRLRVAQRERLEHAEEVVDPVRRAVPGRELADRHVQRARDRAADGLVGPRLELARSPQALQCHRPERVEQHGLADAAQAGEHHGPLGPGPGHSLEYHLELADLPVSPGELRRPLPGTGRVGVPYGVHDRTL